MNSPNSVCNRPLGDALHRALLPQAVADQIGDRADLEAVPLREGFQVRPARHGAVVVHDLDDDRGRIEPGEPREIAARFGVTGAREHAARLRHDGKDVARLAQILGTRIRFHRGDDRLRAVVRGDAGGDAFGRLDGQREVGAMFAMRLADHERQPQLAAAFGGQREADEAAAESRHEVDVIGAHLLRRHDEVAFVLAILVVHDHHHAPGGDVGEDLFDAVERFHL